MGKTFYDLSCEELCDLMCGNPEEDFEVEYMGRGSSKAGGAGGNAAASNEFSNYPADFGIQGIKELKDFEGTRAELYDLIAKNNPTAIIDKRTADVYIGEGKYARDNDHYFMILKKVSKNKMKLNIMWKTKGKSVGQYYIQENRFRPLKGNG